MKYILLERKERWERGKKCFIERWVEPKSNSGIAFFTCVKRDGSKLYVVEDYGIETIDPDTFAEMQGLVPLDRCEYTSLKEAREGLEQIKRENLDEIECDPEYWFN